jgi:hypothetical protein
MSVDADHDVAVVGGGPAGCSAGVFTAREGLDTVIFDRGRSSIKRCAHLENYLGFPGGIDVETLYGLMQDHAETAGCTVIPDRVESIDRLDDGDGFTIDRQEGETVSVRRVVAATRYGGEYLRGLDDDAAMFETYEHDGESSERFDREYADRDGTTPVDGLYVASPSPEADTQAIMAAGRGARVARRVIADARSDAGRWESVAEGVDWMRRESTVDGKWTERAGWIEWFDEHHGESAPVDPDSERFERVREAYVDDRLSAYLSDEEIDSRAARGRKALLEHLDPTLEELDPDPETIVDSVGTRRLLGAIDVAEIEAHLEERTSQTGAGTR